MPGFCHASTYKQGSWAYLKSQLLAQRDLLAKIRAALPPGLAAHAEYCVIAEKKLLLYTRSSSWASQLRFYEQSIVNAVQTECAGKHVSLQVRLLFQNHPPAVLSRQAKRPGHDTVRIVEAASAGITDPTLKASLQRLAAVLKKNR